MATPLNTTIEGVAHCNRQILHHGTPSIISLAGSNGLCPGTQTSTGHYRCCDMSDLCLGYGICYHHHHNKSTNTTTTDTRSAFYIGGCNDPEYADDIACTKICSNQTRPDIVYDYDHNAWRCCGGSDGAGDGHVRCDKPSRIAFLAPNPESLMEMSSNETVDGVRLGTATVAITALIADNTTTAAPSSTLQDASNAHSSELTSAAYVGIAVGVVVPIVLLVVVGFFVMQRRKVRKGQIMEMRNAQWFR